MSTIEAMSEIIDAVATIDDYTWAVVAAFVCVAAILIREVSDSTLLALFSAPLLFVGALLSNYLFRTKFIMLADDKDTNVVVATAVGVILAYVLLMISLRISASLSERRTSRQQLMELPDVRSAD